MTPPTQSLPERLSQWLGVADAITVFAALNRSPGRTAATSTAAGNASKVREEVLRVRTALANSIAAVDSDALARKARIQLPGPTPDAPLGITIDFLPYRRHYLTQQRTMGSSVATLRARVRDTLLSCPPQIQGLAALDAAWDQGLVGREQDLLATVPVLLERRFEQLRKEHQQVLVETQTSDDPDSWMLPGGWLARFCEELQELLQAELELRLQPVLGLIEAYGDEVAKQQ